MIFDINYVFEIIPKILEGLGVTAKLTIASFALAIVLGLILTLIDFFQVPVLKTFLRVYISFFRSTPSVALLYFVYFGMPFVFPVFQKLNAEQATILTLGFSVSAYISETFRSAVASIDDGQMEAALSIGMTKMQGLRRIIFPQALRIAVPNLGNNLIMLLKSVAVSFTIGIAEVMGKAKIEASKTYRYFEAYAVVILVYWLIVILVSSFQTSLEKKLTVKSDE